jgi:hypothetical protein
MLPYSVWLKAHGLDGNLHPEDDLWLKALYGEAFSRAARRRSLPDHHRLQHLLQRKKVQLMEHAKRSRLPAPGIPDLSLGVVYEAAVRLREQSELRAQLARYSHDFTSLGLLSPRWSHPYSRAQVEEAEQLIEKRRKWLRVQDGLRIEAGRIAEGFRSLGLAPPCWTEPYAPREVEYALRRLARQRRCGERVDDLACRAAVVGFPLPALQPPYDLLQVQSLARQLEEKEELWTEYDALESRAAILGWVLIIPAENRQASGLAAFRQELSRQELLHRRCIEALGRKPIDWEGELLRFPLAEEDVVHFSNEVLQHREWMERTLPALRSQLLPQQLESLDFPQPPFDWDRMTGFVAEAKSLLGEAGKTPVEKEISWSLVLANPPERMAALIRGGILSVALVLLSLLL